MTHSADAGTAELAGHIEHFKLPEDFTAEKREALLQDIVSLYDVLDEITRSVEDSEDARQREKLREIVAQLVVQGRCSTDILVALFTDVGFHGRPITQDIRSACEKALRAVFNAIHDYAWEVELTLFAPEEIDPDAATIIDVVAVGQNSKRKSVHSRPR